MSEQNKLFIEEHQTVESLASADLKEMDYYLASKLEDYNTLKNAIDNFVTTHDKLIAPLERTVVENDKKYMAYYLQNRSYTLSSYLEQTREILDEITQIKSKELKLNKRILAAEPYSEIFKKLLRDRLNLIRPLKKLEEQLQALRTSGNREYARLQNVEEYQNQIEEFEELTGESYFESITNGNDYIFDLLGLQSEDEDWDEESEDDEDDEDWDEESEDDEDDEDWDEESEDDEDDEDWDEESEDDEDAEDWDEESEDDEDDEEWDDESEDDEDDEDWDDESEDDEDDEDWDDESEDDEDWDEDDELDAIYELENELLQKQYSQIIAFCEQFDDSERHLHFSEPFYLEINQAYSTRNLIALENVYARLLGLASADLADKCLHESWDHAVEAEKYIQKLKILSLKYRMLTQEKCYEYAIDVEKMDVYFDRNVKRLKAKQKRQVIQIEQELTRLSRKMAV